MIVYPLVFVVSLTLAGWAGYQRRLQDQTDVIRPRVFNTAAVLVFLVLAGVSSLRWRVGTDYWAYDVLFESYAKEFPESIQILGEPGIRFLAWVSASINAGSAGMFALAAIITIGLIVRTIWRWSVAFGFGIGVFILAGAWHGSFNGVRQYLAAAILFAGHRYVVERRFVRWMLVVILATLFHVSALIGVLMYFIPRKRLSFIAQIIILSVATCAMFGTGAVLEFAEARSDGLGAWDGTYAEQTVNPLRVAFRCLPLLLLWLLPVKGMIDKRGDWFYANMLLIIAASAIAGASSAYLSRFAIYPNLFLPIALSLVTSLAMKKERFLIRSALIAVMAVFMYAEISASNNLSNFQWIFNKY